MSRVPTQLQRYWSHRSINSCGHLVGFRIGLKGNYYDFPDIVYRNWDVIERAVKSFYIRSLYIYIYRSYRSFDTINFIKSLTRSNVHHLARKKKRGGKKLESNLFIWKMLVLHDIFHDGVKRVIIIVSVSIIGHSINHRSIITSSWY